MVKIINKKTIAIEHFDGNTYMAFEILVDEKGEISISENTSNCSLADVDSDYLFPTNNELYRIQADKPLSFTDYENTQETYKELYCNE